MKTWRMRVDSDTTWTMRVDSDSIEFYRDHKSWKSLKFRGNDGRNARSAFNTFWEWVAIARANQVEPFEKRISSDCLFYSLRKGSGRPCELSYNISYDRTWTGLNRKFTEEDIAKFSELLNQLSEVNAERLAKESKKLAKKAERQAKKAKAKQEQGLFK